MHYGKQPGAAHPPLVGLNTSAFPAGLQLNLAGLSANIELSVTLAVELSSGQQYDNGPQTARPVGNAFSMKIPWAGFVAGPGHLPLPSDIVGVSIIWETITNATFGITSLQALPWFRARPALLPLEFRGRFQFNGGSMNDRQALAAMKKGSSSNRSVSAWQ